MTNTKLARLSFLKQRVGAMSSEEALDLAIYHEGVLRSLPVYDIAYTVMLSQYNGFMEYAELLCDNGE